MDKKLLDELVADYVMLVNRMSKFLTYYAHLSPNHIIICDYQQMRDAVNVSSRLVEKVIKDQEPHTVEERLAAIEQRIKFLELRRTR